MRVGEGVPAIEVMDRLMARFAPFEQVAWDRIAIEDAADRLEAAGLLRVVHSGDVETLSPALARALVEFAQDLADVREHIDRQATP